jgi:hypothetical protein
MCLEQARLRELQPVESPRGLRAWCGAKPTQRRIAIPVGERVRRRLRSLGDTDMHGWGAHVPLSPNGEHHTDKERQHTSPEDPGADLRPERIEEED